MQTFPFFNDGTTNAPRLQLGQSLWAMEKLPMNAAQEWTLQEKIEIIKEAGFQHVECWIKGDEQGKHIAALVRESGLQLVFCHRPMNVSDTLQAVETAADFGAQFVMCQPATAYHSLPEVASIVTAGAEKAAVVKLPYFVETHRNNFTETIPQTLELITAIPNIAITADFSHFVVVGEFYGWAAEGAVEHLRPIIERVGHVHGRISNGEQVQVDVGDGTDLSEGSPAGLFFELWRECFSSWKLRARPGDVMPFTSELGPPRYAITTPDGREFSDRWQQALVLRAIAQRAWNAS
ncbi:sugar phosphate isomerase/epimerase [bacterium]|nr:MAG: sugar phosphate isomerase/epimerase [bacterium]